MRTLLIPSAKLVDAELQSNFGAIPPVLVPLDGVVALRRIVAVHGQHVDRAVVLVDEGADLVDDYLAFFPDIPVTVQRVDSGASLADTVLAAADVLDPAVGDTVLLNLGDTLVGDLVEQQPDLDRDFCVFAPARQTQRWTLFRTDANGDIAEISNKTFQLDESPWRAFVGVWGFTDFARFAELLRKARDDGRTRPVDVFFDAYLGYCDERRVAFVPTADWTDYGHLDNLNLAHRQSMNLRSFNAIEFTHGGSTVRKTSTNTTKLINEIRWFLDQPADTRVFTPTVYDFSLDPSSPFVELEYYAYPSLAESYVYSRLDFDTWRRALAEIFRYVNIERQYLRTVGDPTPDLVDMYETKTRSRLATFADAAGEIDLGAGVVVDGLGRWTQDAILQRLLDALRTTGALTAENHTIVHGDLCFGNVLYDASHNLLKLIDPRGSFGKQAIHGDLHYDLAKLSHSVLGLYDFVIFGQFAIERVGPDAAIALRFRSTDYHEQIGRIFTRLLASNGFDVRRVRAIEAALFLSMLPLHADRPDRQLAMLTRAIQILAALDEHA